MTNSDLALPWFTNQIWILLIFLAATATFHVLFVWTTQLTSIAWKRVDYIWLSLALIGILGAVASNRMVTASSLRNLAEARMQGGINYVQATARLGVSPAICQTLHAAPGGPPPAEVDRVQREIDEQCAWFKRLVSKLDTYDTSGRTPIDPGVLAGPRPNVGDVSLYRGLDDSVRGYNEALRRLIEMESAREIQPLEALIRILGPALLAIALALRITRVTGEIQLEYQKARMLARL